MVGPPGVDGNPGPPGCQGPKGSNIHTYKSSNDFVCYWTYYNVDYLLSGLMGRNGVPGNRGKHGGPGDPGACGPKGLPSNVINPGDPGDPGLPGDPFNIWFPFGYSCCQFLNMFSVISTQLLELQNISDTTICNIFHVF